MPRLHRIRLEPFEADSTPDVPASLPTPASQTSETPAAAPHASAPEPSEAALLPRITLRLPAVDPADVSAETLQIRATMSRLPAVRKQDLARLPRTTLRLPALPLEPEPSDRARRELARPAQRAVLFIAGAGETNAARVARLKTPTRVRVLFRLALLPLAFLLLLGAQSFAAQLTRDCRQRQAGQQTQTCLALGLFSPFSSVLPYSAPRSPATVGHAPAGPKLPSVPTDLPGNMYAFVKLALPYAFQAHEALGWQTSVILAQWGLEEGWYVPSATGYNWGNVRSVPGAPTVSGSHLSGSFAYASTPAAGLRYYLYAARLPYYSAVTAAARHGANATAVALGLSPWAGGHYTSIGQPGSSLLAIMRTYNLYRLD